MRRRHRRENGWLIVFRPDMEAEADGLEDEAWTVIFRSLARAKEDCEVYIEDRRNEDPDAGIETTEIEWAEDRSSSPRRRVHYGRPKASIDGDFYIYQVGIE
jgi:hypothetical protein